MHTKFYSIFGFLTGITISIRIVKFSLFMQHFVENLMYNSQSFNVLNSKEDMSHNTKRCILCT